MSFFLRASYVHHGKQNEYQRLNQIDEKFQRHYRQGNKHGNEKKQDNQYKVSTFYVTE